MLRQKFKKKMTNLSFQQCFELFFGFVIKFYPNQQNYGQFQIRKRSMPGKKNKEVDLDSLPPINRQLVVLNVVNMPEAASKLAAAFEKSERKDMFVVSEKSVLEYAEENELYLDTAKLDPKKKMPEGIPTELTDEMMLSFYGLYLAELDTGGRLHKQECLEAEEKGKPPPEDPRFSDKAKAKKAAPKKKKKGGDSAEDDEKEEKLLPDGVFEGDFDYVYVLPHFGYENIDQYELLKGFKNVVFMSLEAKNIKKKEKIGLSIEEEIKLLRSQIKDPAEFMAAYRLKIDRYINGEESSKGSPFGQEGPDYQEQITDFHEKVATYIRETPSAEGWRVEQLIFDWFDVDLSEEQSKGVAWHFFLREKVVQRVCELSQRKKEYIDWLMGLKLVHVVDQDPHLIVQRRKEEAIEFERRENERLEEERIQLEKESKKKGKAKKQTAKGSKKGKDKKGQAAADSPEGEDAQDREDQKGVKEGQEQGRGALEGEGVQESKDKDRPLRFKAMEDNFIGLKNHQFTVGIILEGFLEEIKVSLGEGPPSQLEASDSGEQKSLKNTLPSYIDSILAELQTSKMTDAQNLIFGGKLTLNNSKNTSGSELSNVVIINDNDSISQLHLFDKFRNYEKLVDKEIQIFEEIEYPWLQNLKKIRGKETSKVDQKLESTSMVSKIDINLEEFERKNHIMNFERVFNEQEPLKKWNFCDRVYAEKIDSFSLKQKLMLLEQQECDVVSEVDPKLGLCYLGFYYKTPPGRQFYKKWVNEDRLVPSFRRWEDQYLGKEALGEEDAFFNIAEEDLGVISQERSLFFPTDGSLIDVQNFQIKHRTLSRVIVRKSRIIMGVKEAFNDGMREFREEEQKEIEEEQDLEEGRSADSRRSGSRVGSAENLGEEVQNKESLAEAGDPQDESINNKENKKQPQDTEVPSDKLETGCEFWISYDSGTRLHAELEEITVDRQNRAIEESMMVKRLSPTIQNLTHITFSQKSGSIVKLNGNRDIILFPTSIKEKIQTHYFEAIGLDNLQQYEIVEVSRVITEQGVLIKHLSDHSQIIYYPDGTIEFKPTKHSLISVKPDGTTYETKRHLHSMVRAPQKDLKTSERIDPETEIRVLSREDKFYQLEYPNGNKMIHFPDDTIYRINATLDIIVVEHTNYPKVEVIFNQFRARNPQNIGIGSSYAMNGQKDLFQRSFTGRMSIIYLEDGTQVNTYQEMRELPGYNNFRLTSVTIVYGYDSSVAKFESDGEVVLLDALDFTSSKLATPAMVNASGNASFIGGPRGTIKSENEGFDLPVPLGLQDVRSDYYIQLFLPVEERENGVYSIDLKNKVLRTVDSEKNVFKVCSDGKTKSNIAISFNLKEDKSQWDKYPKFDRGEFLSKENLDLPVPKQWNEPQLFLLHKDMTATAFYSEEMLTSYWLKKSVSKARVVTAQDQQTGAVGMTVLTELSPENSKQTSSRDEGDEEMPGFLKSLPKTRNLHKKTKITQKIFSMRILKKFPELSMADREYELQIESKIQEWKDEKVEIDKQKCKWELSTEQESEALEALQEALVHEDKDILVFNEANRAQITEMDRVLFVTQNSNQQKTLIANIKNLRGPFEQD